MKLRDRVNKAEMFSSSNNLGYRPQPTGHSLDGTPGSGFNRAKINEPCKRFNRGHCNFGPNCKYEHRCAYAPCGKFGHSILQCRKLVADKQKSASKSKTAGPGAGSTTSN